MSFISKILDVFKQKNTNEIENDKNARIIKYVQKKIDEGKMLAEIVNTTTDENVFLSSFNKTCKILEELIQYEDKIPFSHLPSEDLKAICNNVDKTISLFQERVKKEKSVNSFSENKVNNLKNKFEVAMSKYDIERFARECNAYTVKEERKEM